MEENKQKDIFNKDVLKKVIISLGVFAVVILIFGAGVFVGGAKARFSYKWAESYHRNFAGPREGFMGNLQERIPMPGDFVGSHGTFGQIIKINDSDFVIQGKVEKVVLIGNDTVIENGMERVSKDKLAVGDSVVVIGSPNNQGEIEAKLIRIFSNGSSQPSAMMRGGFRVNF